MNRQFFVTGIGTDIGKSFISSIIARYWLRCTHQISGTLYETLSGQVAVCKPIMSGVDFFQPDNLINNDAATLLHAINIAPTEANIRRISPWIFAAPLSPHRAAELAGEHIAFDAVIAWCKQWLAQNQNAYVLIEGAGGVAVPINYTHHMADLMQALHLPVIVVASDYLGAISHSITALQFLRQAGVEVAAIVVNQSEASVDCDATYATIAKFSPYPDAPVLLFKRASVSAMSAWRDDAKWSNSDVWQHNQPFFQFFSLGNKI